MVRLLKIILCFAILAGASPVSAQGYDGQTSGRGPGPRKQIATIIFAGLAGGVLGLSTLSFYGRPQDKLANVPMGVGVGVIIGAIYTTFKAASAPREFIETGDNGWNTGREPESWALTKPLLPAPMPLASAGWQWSF